MGEGQRENPKSTLCYQLGARRGAPAHKTDGDLSKTKSGTLEPLRPTQEPRPCFLSAGNDAELQEARGHGTGDWPGRQVGPDPEQLHRLEECRRDSDLLDLEL